MVKFFKVILIASSIFLSVLFGISSGYFQHFPFALVYKILNGRDVSGNNWEYRGRNYEVKQPILTPIKVTPRSGVYLTYGQSNSANSGELGYTVENEVYQFILGSTFSYEDPSVGATGLGGSVWGMVGDELISRGVHDRVIFANSGWGGRKIEELKMGPIFDFLILNYITAKNTYGKVDAILFHQGESDNNADGVLNYYGHFSEFLSNLDARGVKAPVYLSRASFCSDRHPVNIELTDVQDRLISEYGVVHAGPNTDLLVSTKERSSDNCHFSLVGNRAFAKLWADAIQSNYSSPSKRERDGVTHFDH